MYSQNDEERYILNILAGPPSTFLDIGAFDGKTYSNTLALAERGWGGVCVEPSPSVLPRLRELHKDNDKITIVPAMIHPWRNGKVTFFDNANAYATAREENRLKWQDRQEFNQVEVDSLSMDVFMGMIREWGIFPRFINLDTEGMNLELFRELPFNELVGLKCLCVEHDGHGDEIQTHAARFGFKVRCMNAENIIFAR